MVESRYQATIVLQSKSMMGFKFSWIGLMLSMCQLPVAISDVIKVDLKAPGTQKWLFCSPTPQNRPSRKKRCHFLSGSAGVGPSCLATQAFILKRLKNSLLCRRHSQSHDRALPTFMCATRISRLDNSLKASSDQCRRGMFAQQSFSNQQPR